MHLCSLNLFLSFSLIDCVECFTVQQRSSVELGNLSLFAYHCSFSDVVLIWQVSDLYDQNTLSYW